MVDEKPKSNTGRAITQDHNSNSIAEQANSSSPIKQCQFFAFEEVNSNEKRPDEELESGEGENHDHIEQVGF